jgi:hypothetical protein
MTMTSGSSLPVVGADVLTVDGDKLGTVKEVSGSCFKVDAPMGPNYGSAPTPRQPRRDRRKGESDQGTIR